MYFSIFSINSFIYAFISTFIFTLDSFFIFHNNHPSNYFEHHSFLHLVAHNDQTASWAEFSFFNVLMC